MSRPEAEEARMIPAVSHGLVLRGVSAGYGDRSVLRGVTMMAPPGQVTGLIGPNGSGKTTLLRVASRGLRPIGGAVLLGGRDPYSMRAREAARLVAVVPQEVAPVFAFTVLELVLMGRSPYLSPWGGAGPEDWTRARRAMVGAEVQHLADRPFQELSGGERQRVVLAQALAQDAPVLLLDEPTTHLDLGHVFDIMALVRHLARTEDKAVIAVFHDLNLASAFCDRIYVLDGGRVRMEGTPAEVIQPAMIRRVFGVEISVVPNATGDRPAVFFGAISTARPMRRAALRAHVVGGAGRGAELIRALAERGVEVTVGVLHATDSDAFVAERLNLERVTVPPFSHVDERSAVDCRDMIRRARVLILCDAPFGPANLENLRLAVEAAEAGIETIVVDQMPIGERDFTGGEATALWERVKATAAVARSPDEAIDLIMAATRSDRA